MSANMLSRREQQLESAVAAVLSAIDDRIAHDLTKGKPVLNEEKFEEMLRVCESQDASLHTTP